MEAMIQALKFKIGQILCVKKVQFHKSGHIYAATHNCKQGTVISEVFTL